LSIHASHERRSAAMVEPAGRRGETWTPATGPRTLLSLHSLRRHAAAAWTLGLRIAALRLAGAQGDAMDACRGLSGPCCGTRGHRYPDLHGNLVVRVRLPAVARTQENSHPRMGGARARFHCGYTVDPERTQDGMGGARRRGQRVSLAHVARRAPADCAASRVWRWAR